MENKVEVDSGELLSKPGDKKPDVFPRVVAEFEDLSRFKHEKKNFSKQFAHVYASRLGKLRTVLAKKVSAKWGQVKVSQLSELEEMDGARCVIIGTLYKHQELKPSILRELSEEHQLAPPAPRSDYCSDKDQLYLEDEMLRIKLVGDPVKTRNLVTGIVCAVSGHENDNGTFDVDDLCFPGCVPRATVSTAYPKGKLLLLSGLDVTNCGQSLALSLLTEWINGMAGESTAQKDQASVVRVIIAGNSVRGTAEVHNDRGHSGAKAQDSAAASETAIAAQRFDSYLSQIVERCPVTLMPGQYDPTSHMIPQQPLHPCILPKSARFKSLHGATNPWIGSIGSRIVSGSSGQPIEDIMKVNGIDDVSPLMWLERTLVWRHFCPTAPDTLPSYPYCENDPLIMQECPDIYFAGNMDKYETKLWEGDDGQKVRLICIPRFSESKTAVLVDLKNLDTQSISFGTS